MPGTVKHLRGFFVECYCILQLFFARGVFFGWNAINVRILNPGQIEIEGRWGEEKTLTLRGQPRSQCASKKNVKQKKHKQTNKKLTFISPSISLYFTLEWTTFYRFPVTPGQLSTLSFSLSLSGCGLTTVKFRK